MDILTPCIPIEEFVLPSCPETIKFDVGLDPATAYVVEVTDKFGIKERYEETSAGDGTITITSNRPEVFNEFAGMFRIVILEDECPAVLTICEETYEVLHVRFEKYDGDAPEAIIDCECA